MRNRSVLAQLASEVVMQNVVEVLRKGAKRIVLAPALILGFTLFAHLPAFAVQSVTLAWDASPDPSVTGYYVYIRLRQRHVHEQALTG